MSRAALLEIIAYVQRELANAASTVELDVLDPDAGRGRYAGERVDGLVHRPLRVWVDLAERLGLRLLTPRPLAPPLVRLVFERLDPSARLAADADDPTEKYGTASTFARISKLEDPGFVLDIADALARCALPAGARILD